MKDLERSRTLMGLHPGLQEFSSLSRWIKKAYQLQYSYSMTHRKVNEVFSWSEPVQNEP
jgi:hypothetical protein